MKEGKEREKKKKEKLWKVCLFWKQHLDLKVKLLEIIQFEQFNSITEIFLFLKELSSFWKSVNPLRGQHMVLNAHYDWIQLI